jgi:GNAT superfamily N-acetyltransferase
MSWETAQTLFEVDAVHTVRAVELRQADVPQLQRFFDANPDYFVSVGGEPASENEAQEEFRAEPPAGWPFMKKWALGFVDAHDSLCAMATVITDLFAPGVWHIDLFVLETRQHGRGVGRALFDAFQRWALTSGAQWLRLGVVEGCVQAEQFWTRMGFAEVRRRQGVPMKSRVQTLRVMVKPLADMGLDDYLAQVARDRP